MFFVCFSQSPFRGTGLRSPGSYLLSHIGPRAWLVFPALGPLGIGRYLQGEFWLQHLLTSVFEFSQLGPLRISLAFTLLTVRVLKGGMHEAERGKEL